MQIIDIPLGDRHYPVYVGENIIRQQALWKRHLSNGEVYIVTNTTVAPLYLKPLQEALGCSSHAFVLPDGEAYKTLDYWQDLINRLVMRNAKRDCNIIALGGGVIGDLAGFVAASYMRGVNLIQIPTTLLAQVDASVGGKTAVNHQQGKNLIGAFYQPSAVWADIHSLDSLGQREYTSGLAEVVKYAAIRDTDFFAWLEQQQDAINARLPDTTEYLVCKSIRHKAAVVAEDEREAGVRALLNFGHTFAHAIETVTGYQRYLHGEAVAIGMCMAAELSRLRGLCSDTDTIRLTRLLNGFRLPVQLPGDIALEDLINAMQLDKKATEANLRLILLRGLGQARIETTCSREQITQAILHCQQ